MDAVDDPGIQLLGRSFMKKYDFLIDLREVEARGWWSLNMEDFEEPILQVARWVRNLLLHVFVVDHVMLITEEASMVKLQLRSENCFGK